MRPKNACAKRALAHTPMHTLAHGAVPSLPLPFMVVLPHRRVLLLSARVFALAEDAQVLVIRVNQPLRRPTDIRNQAIQQIKTHTLPHHHPQNLNLVLIWRQRVIRDDILFSPQQVTDVHLLDVRELLLELVAEAEGDDGETGVVICAGLIFLAEDLGGGASEGVCAFGAVNVGDAGIPLLGC